jgi:hypothetical protein
MLRPHAELADRLRAAYTRADLVALGELLAPDVRWGDDDHPNRCRSREDVLKTFAAWTNAGVTAEIDQFEAGPLGVMCRVNVLWADPEDRARDVSFFHVFMATDGLITEIRRFNDAGSARAAIQRG